MFALFTNVPLKETIDILVDKAFEGDWFYKTHSMQLQKQQLTDLLEIATTNQLFQFNGKLYEQTDGVAMGSPLGPLLANAFMCHIENQLEQKSMIPSFYRRYVDDTLVTMPNTELATDFLQVLNNVHPSLSFTMELDVHSRHRLTEAYYCIACVTDETKPRYSLNMTALCRSSVQF